MPVRGGCIREIGVPTLDVIEVDGGMMNHRGDWART